METNLEELGFEKYGNNYCLEDTNFKYDIYLFDRPSAWKWEQELLASGDFRHSESD